MHKGKELLAHLALYTSSSSSVVERRPEAPRVVSPPPGLPLLWQRNVAF